ncbi:MAG: hypothetical protein JW990_03415 [Thermoleophilia bacterium]|nr:hypothetical protein [Thermoleophilia bacterium]
MRLPSAIDRQIRGRNGRVDDSAFWPAGAAILIVVLLCCALFLAVEHPSSQTGSGLDGGVDDAVDTVQRLAAAIAAEPERADLYLGLGTAEMMLGHNKAALRALKEYERLNMSAEPIVPTDL